MTQFMKDEIKQTERRTVDRRRAPTGPNKGIRSGEERRVSPAVGEFAIMDAARLRKREAILIAALRFYAHPVNWETHDLAGSEEPVAPVCPILEDVGDRARQAILEAEKLT